MKIPITAKIHSHKASGTVSVVTAVTGNLIVAAIKMVGWFITGSSVMLSEGIHSLADTANQALLLLGIKRSERPADDDFQYGYRQERFFWSLISACGIFFVGAGVTFYHGIGSIIHEETAHFNAWTFIILAASLCLEGYALLTAYKEAKHAAGDESIFKYMKHSGDPTILAVIYEDSAALIGIIIATLSIILTYVTGNTIWDGVGSVVIALLLGVVSVLLMRVNRRFILNKSVPRHMREKIREALLTEEMVDEVHDFKTVMSGVDVFMVKAEIEVNGHYLADKIFNNLNMKAEFEKVKELPEFIRYSSDLCDRTTRILGREIDEIEKRIIEKVPNIRHIDIEAN